MADENAIVRVDPDVDADDAIAQMSAALETAGFKGWDTATEKRLP